MIKAFGADGAEVKRDVKKHGRIIGKSYSASVLRANMKGLLFFCLEVIAHGWAARIGQVRLGVKE
jgi:hypothetical protein